MPKRWDRSSSGPCEETRSCCSRRRGVSPWSECCATSREGAVVLYHLLAPLARQHILFNLFNYITFRAAGATVTALLLAFVLGPWIIRKLREHNVGQVVRAEGPASHQGKRGTPTMGGVIILLSTIIATLLWSQLSNRYVLFVILATLWMGGIGFVDDYLKIVEGKSRGLVAKWKLAGQVSFGVVLGILLVFFPVV